MPRIRLRETEKKKKVCEWVFMPEAGWCSACYANLTFRILKQYYADWEMRRSEVFVKEAKWNLRFESYIVLSSQKAEKERVCASSYMFRALLRRILSLGIIKHCLNNVCVWCWDVWGYVFGLCPEFWKWVQCPFPSEDDMKGSYSEERCLLGCDTA